MLEATLRAAVETPCITAIDARRGSVASEDLSLALNDTERVASSAWLRLFPLDLRPYHLAESLVLAGPAQLSAEQHYAGALRESAASGASTAIGAALVEALPECSTLVIEDAFGLSGSGAVLDLLGAISKARTSLAVVLVAYRRLTGRARRLVARVVKAEPSRGAAVDGWPFSRSNAELTAGAADRLARLTTASGALARDVLDAAVGDRQDVIAQAVCRSRTRWRLTRRISERLLVLEEPAVLEALWVALSTGYWHPDLSALRVDDRNRLRPWMVPLEQGWYWLRPVWGPPLAAGFRVALARDGQRARDSGAGQQQLDLGQPPERSETHAALAESSATVAGDTAAARAASPELADTHPSPRTSAGRPVIRARMLGSFELTVDGHPVRAWRGQRGPMVLRYLIARRDHACPRDVLLEVFWPNVPPDAARNRLQVAVSAVRRTLREVLDLPLVEFHEGHYRLNPSIDLAVDVDDFERHMRAGRAAEQRGAPGAALVAYRDALAVYQDEYLADTPYEDWTLMERERLRLAHLEILDRMAELLWAAGRIGDCIEITQIIVGHDPCREDAHRLLMRCHARRARIQDAARQFDLCVRALHTELGAAPSSQTLDLYREICGKPPPAIQADGR